MAVIDLQANTKNDREMTSLEQQHARLIGALLVCAKLLQASEVSFRNGRQADAASALGDSYVSLISLFQGDGKRMETEALQLAELLGFRIEQHYVPAPSGGVH